MIINVGKSGTEKICCNKTTEKRDGGKGERDRNAWEREIRKRKENEKG